ncbi:hypothetical protein BH09PLA1_BH09PLA1_05030 [soil metagenome]
MPSEAVDRPTLSIVKPTAVATDSPPRKRLPSVRLLITLIVVIPIAGVSGALIAIATLTSNQIAEQFGREIITNTTAQVSNDVREYLGSAVRVSDLYARRLAEGVLSSTDLAAWETPMFHDLAVNPDVASICFSTLDGDCTWLLHAHDRLELGMVRGSDKDHAIEFAADSDGKVDRSKPIRVYRYDATARPWFKAATASNEPGWTPIYFWFGEGGPASETGTGYTRIVRDSAGTILGVLVIDVTLGSLSKHLKDLPITQTGQAFIVDQQGLIVAASDGLVNSLDGHRMPLAASNSEAAQAIARVVATHENSTAVDSRHVQIDGAPARVQATRLEPYPGIQWQVVTVLPESSFLSKATSLRHRAILLAAGAIVAGLALGLFLSRRLSDPLIRLSAHVARVGAGDFDSQLHLGYASELRAASDEVNRMAGGLKERMMLEQSLTVAQQVQQSLLPPSIPAVQGLQIAACCKYCDATGGDYYDFIDIDQPDRPPGTLLIVGDVTGHGIGAALLMASARGAVRASARSVKSLGEILTRANRALGVNEDGLFMTLSIMLIDPASRIIRWASAGHDPAIVYHPDTDAFEDLAAVDFPLGVESDVRFSEMQRECATPGSIVLIGTDGIWEARNAAGEMFGKARLREIIRRNFTSAGVISDAIKKAMMQHMGPSPLTDDVTFVIAKITGSAGESSSQAPASNGA